MYKRILLAYDGSESGQKALLDCRDIVQWSGATLTLVAVMPHHIDFIGAEGGFYDPKLTEREKLARSEFTMLLFTRYVSPSINDETR